MANIFGFTFGFCLFGHSIRLHIESNTLYGWFNYNLMYDETSNGITLMFEVCKVQLMFSVLSNCQDFWFNSPDSYFIRQNKLNDEEYTKIDEYNNEDEEGYEVT